jgi:hypothetical protein
VARGKDADAILVASESFSGVFDDGTPFNATRDQTRVRGSHAAAKRWPEYFKPLDVHYDVEQTTAAPGERRTPSKADQAKIADEAAEQAADKADTEPAVEQATAAPGEKRGEA